MKTAETLRARLRKKLGVETRADIVRYTEHFGVAVRLVGSGA